MFAGAKDFVQNTRENFRERAEARPKKMTSAMSKKEAEEIRDTYFQALSGIFGLMDDVIRYTSGGHEQPEIWSTIDDDDINQIVEARLTRAQHSARAAYSVRRTIAWYQQAIIAIIVGPRLWQTMQWYTEHGVDLPVKFRRKRRMRVVDGQAQRAYESRQAAGD